MYNNKITRIKKTLELTFMNWNTESDTEFKVEMRKMYTTRLKLILYFFDLLTDFDSDSCIRCKTNYEMGCTFFVLRYE
jgi:hypothetical protein